MNGPKDGGPAFPATKYQEPSPYHTGMSLRDWFAGMALQGILASPCTFTTGIADAKVEPWPSRDTAKCAYEYADHMLEQREQDTTDPQAPA